MPQTRRPSRACVVFDDVAFDDDMKRMSASATEVARAARRRYEANGVPIVELRLCAEASEDGTSLPGCMKVYLPEPAGRFGMVFRLVAHPSGSRLRYLAWCTPSPARLPRSHRLSVGSPAPSRLTSEDSTSR